MDDNCVLPTLDEMSRTHFDCVVEACRTTADTAIRHCRDLGCNETLVIGHEAIDIDNDDCPSGYQLVMRHGDGEAVLILRHDHALSYIVDTMLAWLDAVHAYEGHHYVQC